MVTEQNSDSGSNPRREHVGDSDWEQLPVNALVVEERLHGPRGLVVDPQTRRVHIQDREVHLTQQSFDLLAYLLHERGRVVSNDELIRAGWGHTVIVGRHFVQTAVYRLRVALRTAGVAGVDDGHGFTDPHGGSGGVLGESVVAAVQIPIHGQGG